LRPNGSRPWPSATEPGRNRPWASPCTCGAAKRPPVDARRSPASGRVGHHRPTRPAAPQCRDRPRVPGRLQRHLVVWTATVHERPHLLRCRREAAGLADKAVLPDRHLREAAVHIQPDAPPRRPRGCSSPRLPFHKARYRSGAGGRNDTYGSARAAQPGKLCGHPSAGPLAQFGSLDVLCGPAPGASGARRVTGGTMARWRRGRVLPAV
jgi:hypothetical protein